MFLASSIPDVGAQTLHLIPQRICTSVIALTAICASFTTVLMAQPEITLQADNTKAHWQDAEVDVLLQHLIENHAASGDGRNFTMATFNNAAAALNADGAIQRIGPPKTGKMVKTKWTSLKKIFNQIEIYRNVSGFHWDNVRGAGIEGTAAASVWDTYIDPKVHHYNKVHCNISLTHKKSCAAIRPFRNKGWPLYSNMQMILGDNSGTHGRNSLHPATAPPPSINTTDDVLDSIDGGLDLLDMDVDVVSAGAAGPSDVPDMSPNLMMPSSNMLHDSSTTTHAAGGSQSSKCLHTNTLLNLTETSSQITGSTPMSTNPDTQASLPLSSTLVSSQLLAPKKAQMLAHGNTQMGISSATKIAVKITPATAIMNMQGSINRLTDVIEKDMNGPLELPVPSVPTIISCGLGIMHSKDGDLTAAQRASLLHIFSLAGGDNKLTIYIGLEDDFETRHAFISQLLESPS
ncbi:hypothetical protein BDR03DRAFT_987677 [Suillus americanus]|nr:hypothetical protein BDR03DRAFT_987677 [Suillus americanus]